MQRNLLLSLSPPNPAAIPSLSTFENWFRRPWVDMSKFNFEVPAYYMPSYGREVAFTVSYALLLLQIDFPADQKVTLTNDLVQYGIDNYGCVEAGWGWPAFGGHASGRKAPVVFAGILLGNDAMRRVSDTYKNRFGEDMQTVYVKQLPPAGTYQQAWQGAKVIHGGHYGVDQDTGVPKSAGLYGPYEQLQPKDWPIINGNEQIGEAYRRCCTSQAWVGEALAMRMLHAQSYWNHPAFFDYVDRWMTEDDTQAVADIQSQSGYYYGNNWQRQRQTRYLLQGAIPQNTFIDDMWAAYRSQY